MYIDALSIYLRTSRKGKVIKYRKDVRMIYLKKEFALDLRNTATFARRIESKLLCILPHE